MNNLFKIYKLVEVSDIFAGGDKPKNFSNVKDEIYNIPVYANGETNNGLQGYTDKAKIIIPSVTVSARGTIGFAALRIHPFVPIVRLLTLTPKKDILIVNYLYYYLKLYRQNGIGSSQAQLTVPEISKKTISIPSLNTQQKIAKVLSDLDAKIELNNKINAELEAMAKTLYDYWFVQFDFPDANGKPYKTSKGKMVWNEELKREIPEGWEVKNIGEVTDVKAGGDKPKEYSEIKTDTYKIPIFSNGITNDGLYGYTKEAKILKPSLTVSARGTIGYCVLRNKPFVPIIRLIVITPKNSYEVKYFYEFIKNLEFENSGSVQQQLTVPQISNLKIILPSIDLLKKYEFLTSAGIDKIEINKKENQELASLRDWLLPMLMNGQVSVGGYEVEERELGMVAEGGVEYKRG